MDDDKNLDGPYLEKIEDTSFEPIFILGLARSGTSILYKMLTKTGCFNAVTAYHIIRYDQLLYNHFNDREEEAKKELNRELSKDGVDDRGIDRLEITSDFPEEYGYILGSDVKDMYIKPDTVDRFTEMSKKIQFISENDKPLLLKNPFDFPNIGYIKEKFPNSKFVFIARDPVDVLDSTFRAFHYRLSHEKNNPYTMRIFDHYRRLYNRPVRRRLIWFFLDKISVLPLLGMIKVEEKAAERFTEQIQDLPEGSYISVKYEQLCKTPQKDMERILEFLDCEPEKDMNFSKFISPRDTDTEPCIEKLSGYILDRMQPYCEFFGYETC